jgi:transcription antitermination factor NusG
MTWYAIRTMPGAQQPKREYRVEKTTSKRGKGYRLVPSLNPDISAIERELDNAGFVHYMPVARREIRDRYKTGCWTSRRFALLLGYVFVADVTDWVTLSELPGVAGIVGIHGVPLAVPVADIMTLRTKEAEADAKFEQDKADLEARERRVSQKRSRKLFPVGSRIKITSGHAEGRSARIAGSDRDGKIKAILDGLNAAGTISVPLDAIELLVA